MLDRAREAAVPNLFLSTRQGRQTNCVLTVEVGRHLAELLGRRLVLPPCASSPLGEQACAALPELPPQRQVVVQLPLTRVLQARDLSRCNAPAGAAAGLVAPTELPISAEPRNATCLHIGRGQAGTWPDPVRGSACDRELAGDPQLRSLLGLRFTRQLVFRTVAELRRGVAAGAVPPGDVYAHAAFTLFAERTLGPHFGLCALPRETESVARMARRLEHALGAPRSRTLCVHWRAEDFHHASKLRLHPNNTAANVSARAIASARSAGASHVLLLSNARHEALHSVLTAIESAGLRAVSPRTLEGTAFGCRSYTVYSPFAEMVACSRARAFVGTRRSTFTDHIEALRRRGRARL